MGKKMTWLQFAQGWHQAQANDAMKQVARNTRPQPRGVEDLNTAYRQGWQEGWTAGYTEAMKLVQREIEGVSA